VAQNANEAERKQAISELRRLSPALASLIDYLAATHMQWLTIVLPILAAIWFHLDNKASNAAVMDAILNMQQTVHSAPLLQKPIAPDAPTKPQQKDPKTIPRQNQPTPDAGAIQQEKSSKRRRRRERGRAKGRAKRSDKS
jgi:hypothetical protein